MSHNRVLFQSPQFGGLSLGLQYVSRVGELFAIEKVAICIQEKEDEVTQISMQDVKAGERYLMVEENELHEENEKKVSDEPPEVFFMRMRYREQQLLAARRKMVAQSYRHLHAELFDPNQFSDSVICLFCLFFSHCFFFCQKMFDERFLKEKVEMTTLSPLGAVAFPFLKPEFCRLLDEELLHFEESGMPMSQPNSMHTVGLILAEMGLTPLVTVLRKRVTAMCNEL
jgi:hypothetical protein